MTTNGHKPLQGAVILGGKVWRCQKGHEWRGEQAPTWAFNMPAGPGQVMQIKGKATCLVCLVEWAAGQFPLFEGAKESDA